MPFEPVADARGVVLHDVRCGDEAVADLHRGPVAPRRAVALVTCAGRVLFVHHRDRRRWELPGGQIRPGEEPGTAAARELAEETGVAGLALRLAAVASFEGPAVHGGPSSDVSLDAARPDAALDAQSPGRTAVYAGAVATMPRLGGDGEATAYLWWDPSTPGPPDLHPLDAAIARQVVTVVGGLGAHLRRHPAPEAS